MMCSSMLAQRLQGRNFDFVNLITMSQAWALFPEAPAILFLDPILFCRSVLIFWEIADGGVPGKGFQIVERAAFSSRGSLLL